MSDYITDIRQGDTKVIKIDYGKGVDVTGWQIYFILRDKLSDTENAFQTFTTAGDNAMDDIANGLIFLTITATQTASLEPHNGMAYAVKVDKGADVIKTILPPLDDPNDKIKVIDGIEIE